MSIEANKALVRRWLEEGMSQAKLDIVDEVVAPQLNFKTYVTSMHSICPDYTVTIKELIAERDTVVARVRYSGTHEGTWQTPMGHIPPTGKYVTMDGVCIYRIAEGKISEEWEIFDWPSLAQQLGANSAFGQDTDT